MSRPSLRAALLSLTGSAARARNARRELARELSEFTASERTDLTLIAAEDPQGAEVIDILRRQASQRLFLAG